LKLTKTTVIWSKWVWKSGHYWWRR